MLNICDKYDLVFSIQYAIIVFLFISCLEDRKSVKDQCTFSIHINDFFYVFT